MRAHQLGALIDIVDALVSSNHAGRDQAETLDLVFRVNDAVVTYCALITMFRDDPELTERFERSRRLFLSTRADQ
jgi:hypothetical protein